MYNELTYCLFKRVALFCYLINQEFSTLYKQSNKTLPLLPKQGVFNALVSSNIFQKYWIFVGRALGPKQPNHKAVLTDRPLPIPRF